jgi:Leucine-rich repeat (LRR) protein
MKYIKYLVFLIVFSSNTVAFGATDCTAVTEIPPVECEALMALYSSTDGANWTTNTDWNVTNTPCSWYGITCSSGNVSVVSLDGINLNGSLPPELGNLSALQTLYLGNNQLSGLLPPELGNLAALKTLNLKSNQFSGSLPSELGNLVALQKLYFQYNQFSGSLPPELGNLVALQLLNLKNNQLTGSLSPEFGNLAALQTLDLGTNQLSGSLPTELGNLTALQIVYLQENQFSGSLPSEIGNLAALQILNLKNNKLSGSLPPELGNLTALQTLDLQYNQFSGSLPAIGNLAALQTLYLQYNQFSGSLPTIGNLAALQTLNLRDNQLSGSLPAIGNLVALQTFNLRNNQLSGSLPAEIGNLAALQTLNLGNNQFSGSLPLEIGNLANLQYFYLENNQFSGNIPTSITNLSSLSLPGLELECNGLITSDSTVISFLDLKMNPGWTENIENQQDYCLNPPTNLVASLFSETQIDLSWTDNSNETGFKIERDGVLIATTAANATNYNDTDVSCNPSYNYAVKATNGISDTTAATTTVTCIIAPTNLVTHIISDTQIDLFWADNSSYETGFEIERNGTLITTTAINTTSYTDSNLSCDTAYNYSVKATHANGDSKATSVSVITSACPTVVIFSHELTVEKSVGGTVTGNDINCGSVCTQYFEQGTQITLTAIPDANFVLEGFHGDCDETGTVLIDADKSCTATFLKEHTLTITTNGQGIVNDCGTECTQTHLDGKTVQLSVTPDDGVALSDWHGDCENDGKVLMNGNKSCIANFTQGFTLEVILIGKGTVIAKNLNCSENCSVNFPNDTTVTLEAKPDVEWTLEGFKDDCDNAGVVQITEDKVCTITFVEDANIPNNGDGNGDSIKDTLQNNIVTLQDSVDGEYLTLEVEPTCSIDNIYADKPENQGNYDNAYEFPQGLMYFDLRCAETDIIIYFHALRNAQNPILHKYAPTTPGNLNTLEWFVIPNVVFGSAIIGGQTVVTATYHLIDGELGDHTVVDGRIIDPVGLSIR